MPPSQTTHSSIGHDIESKPLPQPPPQDFAATLDWDGPDDPDNPKNWTSSKRWFNTLVPGFLGSLVTVTSSIYVAGVFQVMAEFKTTFTVAILGLSMYIVGMGLGPMLSAPLSELYGRRIVYLVNLPIFLLFTVGAGLAQNIETLIICRTLAGIFGSPGLAVGAGSFVDIWELKSSGAAVCVTALATFIGPAFGPLLGGLLVSAKDWRWTMWFVTMYGAFLMIPFYFTVETYKPVLLKRRAVARGLPLPPKLDPKTALKLIFTVTLARPMTMLVTEPIVQAMSVYSSFAFAVLFGFFEAYPQVFLVERGFTLQQTGFAFMGIAVGLFIGCGIYLLQDRLIYLPALERASASGQTLPPEMRLVPAMIGSFLMPIGLFWFAWTSTKEIHWISPVLAGVPFSAGLVLVFLTAVMYMMEIYPFLVAASAIAALGLLRYLMAMPFPLFTVQMYQRLGLGWATSLLGFISLAMLPIPWVFKKWGPGIRAMSRYDAVKG